MLYQYFSWKSELQSHQLFFQIHCYDVPKHKLLKCITVHVLIYLNVYRLPVCLSDCYSAALIFESFCPHVSSLPLSPSLQESILSHVQRIVKGEVSLAMKEQQAVVTSSIMQAMRSAAGTPVPTTHLDYQTQQASILQLLQQGQLNQAFQQVNHILYLYVLTSAV